MKNKLKRLLSELRGFKFVTTLVSVFKKIEREDKTKYDIFHTQKQKQLQIKVTLVMFFNQLRQTNKNFRKRFRMNN